MKTRQHVHHPDGGNGEQAVAVAAAKILAEAESAVGELRAKVERAAEELHAPAGASSANAQSEAGVARLRADIDTQRGADHATMSAIGRDLRAVHSQLDHINAGIVALQTHSLRQTGGVALALSVLLAIAWKMIAG